MSNVFKVYPLFEVTPVRAKGCYVYDEHGNSYLDLYGGHAVISIGHSHPHYVSKISQQLANIGFYSNAIQNPLQETLARQLAETSGYPEYTLFMCSSGAEANENALKLASFQTGKKKVVAFRHGFHGRTAGAVAITDNPNIVAPVNLQEHVVFCEFENRTQVEEAVAQGDVCAIIVESIQGVGGLFTPSDAFLQFLAQLCQRKNICLIADEVQSGFGRTGDFFAHQRSGVVPDLITLAKGMGNGFPVGGVLIHPKFEARYGMLGTTFGGNHLACAASLAVLEVMEAEKLLQNAKKMGAYLAEALLQIPQVQAVRGRGLMMGAVLPFAVKELRQRLLYKHRIFTGSAADPTVLRLLPPLSVTQKELDVFLEALQAELVTE